MAVFLVTWDLNKQKSNYNQARQTLIDHLSRYNHIKDPGLDSVWFIQSSGTADAVSADVRSKMDDNDRVIVTKLVDGQQQGWLDKDVWTWINARL
ncbi:hypothetical protein ABIA00_006212 [Bradyrhizobium ottawaense]|uniref:hypothetical protein n=1 Tax=Bradyrhizobium ottawaense TaxID=931866 RepID=UPI0038396791